VNNNRKDPPEIEHDSKLISDVDTLDREAARKAVSKGVMAAQNQWVPVEYIAEALALELTTIAENSLGNMGAANYLRALATHLEEHKEIH